MVVGSTLCTYDIALQYFHTNGLRNLKSARVFLASGNMRPWMQILFSADCPFQQTGWYIGIIVQLVLRTTSNPLETIRLHLSAIPADCKWGIGAQMSSSVDFFTSSSNRSTRLLQASLVRFCIALYVHIHRGLANRAIIYCSQGISSAFSESSALEFSGISTDDWRDIGTQTCLRLTFFRSLSKGLEVWPVGSLDASTIPNVQSQV